MAIEPNVANVFSGLVKIFLAVSGTAPPSLTTQPNEAGWLAAGFARAGYTEAGADLISTPSSKDIIADESISPLRTLITGVKGEIKIILMETHLENLEKAIALTTLSNPGTGIKTLGLGSGNVLKEFVIGMQGASVGGPETRVVVAWRCVVQSAISLTMKRADVSKLACNFVCLTDSAQAVTEDVWRIRDYSAGS